MRKYLYLLSVLTFIFGHSQARQLVFGPAVVSSLVVNHTAQQAALKDTKENEGQRMEIALGDRELELVNRTADLLAPRGVQLL